MKLESFKEKKQKNIGIIIGIISVVILLAAIYVYRTYSIYQESQEFDVIKGSVPDQNYDIMFTFYLVDENETKSTIETVPEGKDYRVSVSCNNEADGFWDSETWGPIITNLISTRTKCNVIFSKIYGPLKEYGIIGNAVTEGNGLYEVPHEDAEITYTNDETAINNLKMTEYRYAGENPNNYVTFNGEEAGWRIIGLVNTPEGQRIKLIRDESIGNYSWDSSSSSVNYGYGVNEWSQADIKTLLNSGAYYNRTSGKCYTGSSNATSNCDFSSNGLTEEAKEMIDTVTWNTGTNGKNSVTSSSNGLVKHFYNYERSSNTGKICSSSTFCNDTVTRTTSWMGQIGLMYPSDYGYATSGGDTTNRESCLNKELYAWDNSAVSDCKNNDWLHNETFQNQLVLTPSASTDGARFAFSIVNVGNVGYRRNLFSNDSVRPSIYLQNSVKFINGNGTKENPYLLLIT